MSRLNLSQHCLLDVSGELGDKARDKLQDQVATYPAAMLEYEVIRGQFELLRSIPEFHDTLTSRQTRQIGENIKAGIQHALAEQRRAVVAARRRRIMYRVLSVVSGVAACLVIAAGFMTVRREMQVRQARLRDAELSLREMAHSDLSDPATQRYRRIARAINRLEHASNTSLASRGGSRSMMRLLDALDRVRQQTTKVPGAM